jgi:hypothetical protein
MRYSLEHKAQNREKILSMAARSFRERGADSSGIGTVMKKAGLTKGGAPSIRRLEWCNSAAVAVSMSGLLAGVRSIAAELASSQNRVPLGGYPELCIGHFKLTRRSFSIH